MSNFLLFLTRSLLYLGVLLVPGRSFPQYLFNFILRGYFSFFILPLAIFFLQPGDVVMGVVALAFCLFKRHVLKEYWSRFERLSIVFLS